MNIRNTFPLMAMALLTACGSQPPARLTGIDTANLDTAASPGTDFFRYATGGWNDAHPLTAEYSRYGSFDQLAENNNQQLRDLIEDVARQKNEPGSVADKIARMFASAMDSASLNAQGYEPIREDLQRIAGVTEKAELWRLYSNLQVEGVDGLFAFFINADIKDSHWNLLQIFQGGLVMGQREYYLDTDSATTAIRDAYRAYMSDLFTRCQVATPDEAPDRVEAVLGMETRLARVARSNTDLRDDEKNYHKMSYDSLLAAYPGIDWRYYFQVFGAKGLRQVSVGQPEVIAEVEALWQQTPLPVLKDYVAWQLINAAASYLDDYMRAASFNFFGKAISGRQEDRPRWKRALAATEEALGEAVGQLYVQRYFPAAAKERMVQLVRNLQVALGQRIDAQEWMSDSTKAVAREKLDAFIIKVGYPDTWRDYASLEIGPNYWRNVKAAAMWRHFDEVGRKLNQPVDNTEWYMTPQTVNAYYNPATNEICFPAGILQPPFFDMEADDAFNYGAIGVVIGHEMTHGFDDQGAKFDKDGNLRQWWTQEDTRRFEERTHVMRDFFSAIEVLPGLHANGQLTLGENMADHGGLQVAFQAFRNASADPQASAAGPATAADDPAAARFTPEQRFFLAYAGVWAGNIRDEEIRFRTKADPHALGRWRVNGQLPHIDAWYEAFHITPEDPMYVPKEQRVTIW